MLKSRFKGFEVFLPSLPSPYVVFRLTGQWRRSIIIINQTDAGSPPLLDRLRTVETSNVLLENTIDPTKVLTSLSFDEQFINLLQLSNP